MIDWSGEFGNRNYGIKRRTDSKRLSELLWLISSLAVVAGTLCFYAWMRSQIIHVGYTSQQLQAQEESLLRDQKKLILEEQMLKTPERIETIARTELGMTRLRTTQLLTPQFPGEEPAGTDTLAYANRSNSAAEASRNPATN